MEGLDGVGPVEGLEFVDEALGVFGDTQHPLTERAAFDGLAFRFPFFDFLVGKDGAHAGGPVDGGFVDEGETHFVDLLGGPAFFFELADGLRFLRFFAEVGFVELEKDPLRPLDVAGVGGVDLAVPVVGKAEGLELAAEVVDVGLGGDAGMLAGLDGVLLGGETEGVPTHGVEDIESVHALVATDDVGGGVSFGVADVEASAAGVRKHVEDEVFGLGGIEAVFAGTCGAVGLLVGPALLPAGFEFVEGKGFGAFVGHISGETPESGLESPDLCVRFWPQKSR